MRYAFRTDRRVLIYSTEKLLINNQLDVQVKRNPK